MDRRPIGRRHSYMLSPARRLSKENSGMIEAAGLSAAPLLA